MAANCRPQTTGVDVDWCRNFSLAFACWFHRPKLLHFSQKRTRTVTRAADGEMKSDPAPLLGFPCPSWQPFFPILFSVVACALFLGAVSAAIHTPLDKTVCSFQRGINATGRLWSKWPTFSLQKKRRRWRALQNFVASPAKPVTWPLCVCVCVRVYFYLLLSSRVVFCCQCVEMLCLFFLPLIEVEIAE